MAAWQKFKRFGEAIGRRLPFIRVSRRAQPAPALIDTPPVTRTLDDQWSRLEQTMTRNIEKAQGTVHKHAVAALHLDAAHYTLGRIAEELAVAMPPIELKPAVPVSSAFPVAGIGRAQTEAIAA